MTAYTKQERVTKEAHNHLTELLPLVNPTRIEAGKKPHNRTSLLSAIVLSMDGKKVAKL